MPCAVTAYEIDELEKLLIGYHQKHAHRSSLENCTHTTCVDAKLTVAWLRAQLLMEEDAHEACAKHHVEETFLSACDPL